jgi:septum formation protein
MERLLLASNSPRRRELLETAGILFDALAPDIDESLRDDLEPSSRVLALAEDKARAAAALASPSGPRLVLAADTLVCMPAATDGVFEEALGKPRDLDDARRMIGLLSGRRHFVRTGIALLDRSSGLMRSSRSDSAVSFAAMSEQDIEVYLASGEWSEVAGGYRIQGLAALFIERLEGSWTGVVGLPMRELYVILLAAGFRVPSGALRPLADQGLQGALAPGSPTGAKASATSIGHEAPRVP